MKKSIVFIFLLVSVSVFSQQNKWDVGIIGGPSITAKRWTKLKSYAPNPGVGFYAGVSSQYNFNKNFAIHAELAFDQKVTKDNITLTDQNGSEIGDAKIINQLNYLTMPILFRASVGNNVKYFLQTGPYLSYLLNSTYKSLSDNPQYSFNQNITSSNPAMDFGISAGLGIVVPVKEKFAISCALRGNYGLVNILYKTGKNGSSGHLKQYNESINLLVGVTYKLGK
jgi:hypothetical protein